RLSPAHLNLLHTHPTPTALSPLSLHDALPIYGRLVVGFRSELPAEPGDQPRRNFLADGHFWPRPELSSRLDIERDRRRGNCAGADRKSTRLNSSHEWISSAVFCLKKKKVRHIR